MLAAVYRVLFVVCQLRSRASVGECTELQTFVNGWMPIAIGKALRASHHDVV